MKDSRRIQVIFVLLLNAIGQGSSFLLRPHTRAPRVRVNSFFKNLIDQAFQNDDNLSQDEKRTGQIDEGSSDSETFGSVKLTETQQMWRKKTSNSMTDLAGKAFDLDFYLTGAPNKDPSNDLFGARVNISSRDRKVGQAVPESPTLSNIRKIPR